MKKSYLVSGLALATAAFGLTLSQPQQEAQAKAIYDKTATSNYVDGFGPATWKSVNGQFEPSGHYLNNGTKWRVTEITSPDNYSLWYGVGNGEYANSQYFDLGNEISYQELNAVVKVTQQGQAPLVSSTQQVVGSVPAGSEWQTSMRFVNNGQVFYLVGPNQWVSANDASIVSETSRGQKGFAGFTPLTSNEDDTIDYNFISTMLTRFKNQIEPSLPDVTTQTLRQLEKDPEGTMKQLSQSITKSFTAQDGNLNKDKIYQLLRKASMPEQTAKLVVDNINLSKDDLANNSLTDNFNKVMTSFSKQLLDQNGNVDQAKVYNYAVQAGMPEQEAKQFTEQMTQSQASIQASSQNFLEQIQKQVQQSMNQVTSQFLNEDGTINKDKAYNYLVQSNVPADQANELVNQMIEQQKQSQTK